MVKSGILHKSSLFLWFNQTIYLFHVPPFFICSGYLYQKFSKVENARAWGRNALKKAISLGIPFFSFSLITWLLKFMFPGQVNDEIGGLLYILFINPIAPFWFLYALFFIFLVTPTFKDPQMAVAGLILALILKVLGILIGSGIAAIAYIMTYEIWFIIGMLLCLFYLTESISD